MQRSASRVTIDAHLALQRRQNAGQCEQRGRLPSTIGAEQRDDLTTPDRYVEIAHNGYRSIARMKAASLEHGGVTLAIRDGRRGRSRSANHTPIASP